MTALAFKVDSHPDVFRDDFARNGASSSRRGLGLAGRAPESGDAAFAKTGTPTRRVEAWKYTDLANALEGDCRPPRGMTVPRRSTAFSAPRVRVFSLSTDSSIALRVRKDWRSLI
jgi:hypothetical protein